MSRTVADLTPGESLTGPSGPLFVRGSLLLKEWDQEDQCYYHWEEWQIGGTAQADTWVEVDHWARAVYLYEPVSLTPALDPTTISPGQVLTLSSGFETVQARVRETSYGILEEVQGSVTAPLGLGEPMGYAELEITPAQGRGYEVTVDSHGFRDMVAYRKRPLSAADQRRLLGKTILHGPGRAGAAGAASPRRGFVRAVLGLTVGVGVLGLSRACATGRLGGTPSGNGTATDSTWYHSGTRHRSVYGGGGGGVGK